MLPVKSWEVTRFSCFHTQKNSTKFYTLKSMILLSDSVLKFRKRKEATKSFLWSEFSSVQLHSHVRLFETPWTAASQASLSITNSLSSPKLMSIELVMPSNHLILCRPLLLLAFNLSQHQGLFKWVSSPHQVAKRVLIKFNKYGTKQNHRPVQCMNIDLKSVSKILL